MLHFWTRNAFAILFLVHILSFIAPSEASDTLKSQDFDEAFKKIENINSNSFFQNSTPFRSCLNNPVDDRALPYIKNGIILGTWIKGRKNNCKTIKIYFPGQAQELGHRNSRVPENERLKWGKILLHHPQYSLYEAIEKSGCPVILLGESQAQLNESDLRKLMLDSGATKFELIAHSAGYKGLTTTLSTLRGSSIITQLSALKLLDNFYDSKSLPKLIDEILTNNHSRLICQGFYTEHNSERFLKAYQRICPSVQKRLNHKTPVREFF